MIQSVHQSFISFDAWIADYIRMVSAAAGAPPASAVCVLGLAAVYCTCRR
jgi:hypothetical protein